ncbi:MAG TPA: lysophospholipid acyltransferase family protein, partial [Fimbriimonadaceae bacterium]|nr:lysophospholipid acyltransferase family protein [Fimbriimonadaceae bacterium]
MAAELLPARPYPPWNRYVVLPVCKLLCRILFWVLGPIASRGAYRVPREGAVLIMSNHLADVDPIVVQVACPRAVHFMAKSELFEMRFIGRMIRWFQAFPVKRGEPDRASMRHAIDLLKKGEAVALFPEGQLSEDGVLQELKAGVALIVRQAAATGEAQAPASGARTIAARGGGLKVICCGVRNSNRVMPYGRMVPRISGHRVWVEWGEVRAFTR